MGLLVPFLAACFGMLVSVLLVGDSYAVLLWMFISILLWPALALGSGIYGYVNDLIPFRVGASISDDFRLAVALNRHQGTDHVHVVEFNGVVVANDGALVTTDAFSFFDEGDRTLAAFGVGALFASLAVERRSNLQRLVLTALAQLVSTGHGDTTCAGSPSNLATHRFTSRSPKQ